jgi:hypothetical protein
MHKFAILAALAAISLSSPTAFAADIPVYVDRRAPIQYVHHEAVHGFGLPIFWPGFETNTTTFFKYKHLFFKKYDYYGWKKLYALKQSGWKVTDFDIVNKYGKKFVDVDLKKKFAKTETKHSGAKTAANAVVCGGGSLILGQATAPKARFAGMGFGITCAAMTAVGASAAVGGLAGVGLIVGMDMLHLSTRPGGWKCMPEDRGVRDTCKEFFILQDQQAAELRQSRPQVSLK